MGRAGGCGLRPYTRIIMPNLNKIMLMGTLTRDPVITYTSKGTAVADVGLAINRTWTTDAGEKREDVTFVNITLWGRVAEVAGEYAKKGKPLYVEGRLQLDTWDDKETGKKRAALKIIGENIQLLGSKDSTTREQEPPREQARGPSAPPRRPAPPKDPDLDPPDDDIDLTPEQQDPDWR